MDVENSEKKKKSVDNLAKESLGLNDSNKPVSDNKNLNNFGLYQKPKKTSKFVSDYFIPDSNTYSKGNKKEKVKQEQFTTPNNVSLDSLKANYKKPQAKQTFSNSFENNSGNYNTPVNSLDSLKEKFKNAKSPVEKQKKINESIIKVTPAGFSKILGEDDDFKNDLDILKENGIEIEPVKRENGNIDILATIEQNKDAFDSLEKIKKIKAEEEQVAAKEQRDAAEIQSYQEGLEQAKAEGNDSLAKTYQSRLDDLNIDTKIQQMADERGISEENDPDQYNRFVSTQKKALKEAIESKRETERLQRSREQNFQNDLNEIYSILSNSKSSAYDKDFAKEQLGNIMQRRKFEQAAIDLGLKIDSPQYRQYVAKRERLEKDKKNYANKQFLEQERKNRKNIQRLMNFINPFSRLLASLLVIGLGGR